MFARRTRSFLALVLLLLPCFASLSAADSYWVRPYPHGQNYSDVRCDELECEKHRGLTGAAAHSGIH